MAPPATTFAGVAGFVKAIFRWNAPTTQSMEIGQIGGGQTIKTYTGMMNAGPLVLNGTVPEKNFVAGELAFITATTNNVTVSVDFASWVVNAVRKPHHPGERLGHSNELRGSLPRGRQPRWHGRDWCRPR